MSEKEKLELENKLEQIRTWITNNANVITSAGFSVVYDFTHVDKKHVRAVWAGHGVDVAHILIANNNELLQEADDAQQLKEAFVLLSDHLVRAFEEKGKALNK